MKAPHGAAPSTASDATAILTGSIERLSRDLLSIRVLPSASPHSFVGDVLNQGSSLRASKGGQGDG